MANYLIMLYAKNNQDPTPGSPVLVLSVEPTLHYWKTVFISFLNKMYPFPNFSNDTTQSPLRTYSGGQAYKLGTAMLVRLTE
ncbi:hypothetical protein PoB_001859100 [Plakobranchus ocellatus]|uniref:Uncharacterized protein n=1 Tax=Plakobranchus ocellatus TaxID=259542 RepID=A0AAV3Z856_9GAST|nr:hypothetical protein PoB_001859100 [Plakobranchus ocellatus]